MSGHCKHAVAADAASVTCVLRSRSTALLHLTMIVSVRMTARLIPVQFTPTNECDRFYNKIVLVMLFAVFARHQILIFKLCLSLGYAKVCIRSWYSTNLVQIQIIIRPHRTYYVRMRCIVTNRVAWSVGRSVCYTSEPYKIGWIERDNVWVEDLGWPREPCIRWASSSPWEGAISGERRTHY